MQPGAFARPRPPRFRYTASPSALVLLFAGNQRLVVPAIWQALEEVGGRELSKKGLPPRQPRPGRTLQRQDHRHGTAAAAATVRRTAPRRGRTPRIPPRGGRLFLYKRSCPFIGMFDESPMSAHSIWTRSATWSGPPSGRPPAATTDNRAAFSNWQTAPSKT